jgi:single-stranded DNA-specific DHH superfamily exonuclease
MEAQREIFNRAIEEFETSGTDMSSVYAAVIAGDGWHRGVIGLAASKLRSVSIARVCDLSGRRRGPWIGAQHRGLSSV